MQNILSKINRFFYNLIIWTLIFIMGPGTLVSCTNEVLDTALPVSVSISTSDPAYSNGVMTFPSLDSAAGIHSITATVTTKGGSTHHDVKWDIKDAITGEPTSGLELTGQSNGTLTFQIKSAGIYNIIAKASANESLTALLVVEVRGYLMSLNIANEQGTTITNTMEKYMGESFQLQPVYTPEDTSQRNVRWSTDSDAILQITEDGLVTPTSSGTATITLTSTDNPDISTSIKLLIKQNIDDQSTAGSRISISAVDEIAYGESVSAMATVKDGYGHDVTTGEVLWESSEPSVIRLTPVANDNRTITMRAVGGGQSEISATYVNEEGATIQARRTVYVTGALEELLMGSESYTFEVGYKTPSPGDEADDDDVLRVLYYPDSVADTYRGITATTTSDIISVNAQKGYLIVEARESGSAEVTITSQTFPDISYTFTVNVKEQLSPADRAKNISLSRNLVSFEPPFTEGTYSEVTAVTRVYEDASGSYVDGDWETYRIIAESTDQDVVRVQDMGEGVFRISPVDSGEASVTFTSEVNDDIRATLNVSVGGELRSFSINPSSVNMSMDVDDQAITVTPYPTNALIRLEGEMGIGKEISFIPDNDTTVAVKPQYNSQSNVITLHLSPLIPGSTEIAVMADGERITTIPVNVVAGDDDYPTSIWFTKDARGGFEEAVGGLSIAQQADGAVLYINAENAAGETIDLTDEDYRLSLTAGGRTYDEAEMASGRCRIATVNVQEGGRISIDQQEAGTFTLSVYSEENTSAVASVRVEVGGAFTHEGLQAIRPQSNYIQVREGDNIDTGVNFIPSDWEDWSVDWSIDEMDGEQNARIQYTYDDATATIEGLSVGKDTVNVVARSRDSKGGEVSTSFIVEVVEADANAYSVTLDKAYLSFDRNAKEMPTLKATVRQNGATVSSADVRWELQAVEGSIEDLVSLSFEGNAKASRINSVNLNTNEEATGSLYALVSVVSAPEVNASCYVEVVDSRSVFTEMTSFNVVSDYVRVRQDGGMQYVQYTILPTQFQEGQTLDFEVTGGSSNGIEVVQVNDYTIGIIGLESGEYEVTASVRDKDFSDTFTVEVYEYRAEQTPSYIRVLNGSLTLNQRHADRWVALVAEVVDVNNNVIEGAEVEFVTSPNASRFISKESREGQANTLYVRPDGDAGNTYVDVKYPGLDTVRVPISVGAQEVTYSRDVQGLLNSAGSMDYIIGAAEDEGVMISLTLLPQSLDRSEYSVEWSTSNDTLVAEAEADDPFTAKVYSLDGTTGTYTVTAKLMKDGAAVSNGEDILKTFDVKVVESAEYADVITSVAIRPTYVSYDRDAKEFAPLVATFYKGGDPVSVGKGYVTFDWAAYSGLGDDDMSVTDMGDNRATLALGGNDDSTGSGMVEATLVSGGHSDVDAGFTIKAETMIEIVKSSTMDIGLVDLYLNQNMAIVEEGETFSILSTTNPVAVSGKEGFSISYRSDDNGIATVSPSGTVTGVREGSTRITVTARYQNGSFDDTVEKTLDVVVVGRSVDLPRYISLSRSSIELDQMESEMISSVNATVYGEFGVMNAEVDWNVENGAYNARTGRYENGIVSYEAMGNTLYVSPLAAGRTSATATYERDGAEVSAQLVIVVGEGKTLSQPISGLSPSVTGTIALYNGNSEGMRIWVTPVGGGEGEIDWSVEVDGDAPLTVEADSSNSRYATVRPVSGRTGEALVRASVRGGEATAEFTFDITAERTWLVSAVSVTPASLTIDLDSKALPTFNATMYADGYETSAAELAQHGKTVALDWTGVDDDTKSISIETLDSAKSSAYVTIDTALVKESQVSRIRVSATGDISGADVHGDSVVNFVRSSQVDGRLTAITTSLSDTLHIEKGESVQFSTATVPAALASSVEWSYELSPQGANPGTVYISDNTITGRESGEDPVLLTIKGTYTDSKQVESSAQKTITVYVDDPVDITTTLVLSDTTVLLGESGESSDVYVNVYNRNGMDITDTKRFQWSVEDPTIASISESDSDADGNKDIMKITANAEGSTRFSVRDDSMSASGYIIVGEVDHLVGITSTPAQIRMAKNESVSVVLGAAPESFNDQVAFSLSTKADNISIINEDGTPIDDLSQVKFTPYDSFRIVGIEEGYGVVQVQAWMDDGAGNYTVDTGISMTMQVNVSGEAMPERIVFNKGSVEIGAGQTEASVEATIISSTGREYNGTVTWSVDNDSIIAIDEQKTQGNVAYLRPVSAGNTVLNASFDTIRSSINASYNDYGVSEATEPTAISADKTSVILYHPDTTSDNPDEEADILEAKKAEISIQFYPAGLKDQYKGLTVTTGDSSIASARTSSTGKVVIESRDEGTTTVDIVSTIDPEVRTSVRVTVLAAGTIIEGGIPTITLSPNNTSIDVGESALLGVVLRNDDGYMDVGEDTLEWKHDNVDAFDLETPADGDWSRARVTALATGTDKVSVAHYLTDDVYVSAEALVTGTSTTTMGSLLRNVAWNYDSLTMVTGQEKTLQYSIQPDQAEYKVDFELRNEDDNPDLSAVIERVENGPDGQKLPDDVLKVRALTAGTAVATVTVTDTANGVSKSADLTISVTNGIQASTKYSSMTASRSSVTMGSTDSPASISYTLTTMEGEEDLNTPISRFEVYGEGGQLLQTITLDEMRKYSEDPEANPIDQEKNNLFSVTAIGSLDNRTFNITPLSSGEAYLEAYVYDDETGADETKGVLARTYVNITGRVKGVGIASMYMRMAEGEETTVNVDVTPATALPNRLHGKWSITEDGDQTVLVAAGQIIRNRSNILTVGNPTNTSLDVSAKVPGEVKLVFEYNEGGWYTEDGAGYKAGDAKDSTKSTLKTEMIISVETADALMGGARRIAFPESFYEFAMPYESLVITPQITFFDGSTSGPEGRYIDYKVVVENTDKGDGSAPTGDGSRYATVVNTTDGSARVTPAGAGTAYLLATYTDPTGAVHQARATLIIKSVVNSITLSNTAMVIYTGGSATVSAQGDEDAQDSLNFQWQLTSEKKPKTTDGSGNVTEWQDLGSNDRTAFETLINNSSDGTEVVIGAKDAIFDSSNPGFSSSENQGLGADTYPRQGTFRIYSPENPSVFANLIVTVEKLPAENTYPKTFSLDQTRLNLEPNEEGGFDENSEIQATALDRNGTEIPVTVEWYYYPIPSSSGGASGLDWDVIKADYKLNTSIVNDGSGTGTDDDKLGKIIYAYYEDDGQTMLFQPRDSGLYRVKAIVSENPKLQAEATVYVGGAVTGITTDAPARLEIVKEGNTDITAVLSPANALTRDVFFIPNSVKTGTDISHGGQPAGTSWPNVNENYYISYVQNGNTINIYGKNETPSTQQIWVEYWDNQTTSKLQSALEDGVLTVNEYKNAIVGGTLMQSCTINVDIVPKSKTIVTFSIDGLAESIDPSDIESVVSFNVLASASGADSGMTFSDWDWVDVDIVGSESGLIYATSRTKTVNEATGADVTAATANDAGQKKKVAAWSSLALGSQRPEEPIALGGIINRNGSTYSFQLNQAGLATEPMIVKAYLHEEYADGYGAIQRQEEDGSWFWQDAGYSPSYVEEHNLDQTKDVGEFLFDTDEVSYNGGQRLVYIGGRVSELKYGTTYYNLNNNKTSSEGSNVDMILGASAVLTVEYNPSYTHQKGVLWYVVRNTGFNDFEAMQGGNQCSVFARREYTGAITLRAVSIYDTWFQEMGEAYEALHPNASEEWIDLYLAMTDTEHREATEEMWQYPPTSELTDNLYIDFQITCNAAIQEAKFVAYSQGRVGGGGTIGGSYDFLPEELFPATESTNEIWCYDTGESYKPEGGDDLPSTGIDAYYITTSLTPDYDYALDYKIISGSNIGYLDMNEIDKGKNEFRFVPNGPRNNVMGNGTTTAYGDVVIQATNTELNYSKNFTLHYQPSTFKLVKYIGEVPASEIDPNLPEAFIDGYMSPGYPDRQDPSWMSPVTVDQDSGEVSAGSGQWDVYQITQNDRIEVKGLECLVLYPGESFPLSVISFFNENAQYVANGTVMEKGGSDLGDGEGEDGDPDVGVGETDVIKYAIRYAVHTDDTGSSERTLQPGYIEFDNGYMSQNMYTGNDNTLGIVDDPEKDTDTGVSNWYTKAENRITAKKEGVVYLQYSICPIKVEEIDGVDTEVADTSQMQTNGIYVFIVSPADQVTARFADATEDSGLSGKVANYIPYKISASQVRAYDKDGKEMPSHWFMGLRGAIGETIYFEGNPMNDVLYRGRAYALFTDPEHTQMPARLLNSMSKTDGNWDAVMSVGSVRNINMTSRELDAAAMPMTSQDDIPYNLLEYQDIALYGEYGLTLFTGVDTIVIDEDGTLTDAYFEKYAEDQSVFDVREWHVTSYTHHGMSESDYCWKIKKFYPPYQVQYMDLSENSRPDASGGYNGLQCSFVWDGRLADGSRYDIRKTLRKLNLSFTDIMDLTLDNFTQLSVLDIRNDVYDIRSSGNCRLAVVFDDNSQSNLLQLFADNAFFNVIVAEFKEGTYEEFVSIRDGGTYVNEKGETVLVTPDMMKDSQNYIGDLWKRTANYSDGTSERMYSIFSARLHGSGGIIGNRLENIQLSGGIGYVDVATTEFLESLVIGDDCNVMSPKTFSYDADTDNYRNYVQVLNLGGVSARYDETTTNGNILWATRAMETELNDSDDEMFDVWGLHVDSVEDGANYSFPHLDFSTFCVGRIGTLLSVSNSSQVKRSALKSLTMKEIDGLGRPFVNRYPQGMVELDTKYSIIDEIVLPDVCINQIPNVTSMDVDRISEGTYVQMQNSGMTKAVFENMYGILDLSYATNLTDLEINLDMIPFDPVPEGSGLVLQRTNISNLNDQVKAYVELVDVDNNANLLNLEISTSEYANGRTGDLTGVWKKISADYLTELQDVYVDKGASVIELSIAEGSEAGGTYGAIQSLNIQGEDLEYIDLHNAGLYGRDWQIGSFKFKSQSPSNNIDDYVDVSDAEYTKGFQMSSQDVIQSVLLGNLHIQEEYVKDSDGYYVYDSNGNHLVSGTFVYDEPKVTYSAQGDKQNDIDWLDWIPAFRECMEWDENGNLTRPQLIMYGNEINFQWDSTHGTGLSMGAMREQNILLEDPDIAVYPYRTNSNYDSLEKAIESGEATEEQERDWEIIEWRLAKGDVLTASDQKGKYYYGWSDLKLNSISRSVLNGNRTETETTSMAYFTRDAEYKVMDMPESITVYGELSGAHTYKWREQRLNRNSMSTNGMFGWILGQSNSDSSNYWIRFGTWPEELFLNENGGDNPYNLVGRFAVMNKYKQGGLAAQSSDASLSIRSINGQTGDRSGYGTNKASLMAFSVGQDSSFWDFQWSVGDESKTYWASIIYRGMSEKVMAFTSTLEYNSSMNPQSLFYYDSPNGRVPTSPSGLNIQFYHYDESTSFYGADSVSVIYPFGA